MRAQWGGLDSSRSISVVSDSVSSFVASICAGQSRRWEGIRRGIPSNGGGITWEDCRGRKAMPSEKPLDHLPRLRAEAILLRLNTQTRENEHDCISTQHFNYNCYLLVRRIKMLHIFPGSLKKDKSCPPSLPPPCVSCIQFSRGHTFNHILSSRSLPLPTSTSLLLPLPIHLAVFHFLMRGQPGQKQGK